MFHTPDYYHNVSTCLSGAMNDIGVNDKMVLKRRRATLLEEIINTDSKTVSHYKLGSMSEGTTTIGLNSDVDSLSCFEGLNVIQDWCEWTPGKINSMMIQSESTPPGYCLLQLLRPDAPLPVSFEIGNFFVKDTSGRIVSKNTILDALMLEGRYRQGPSSASRGQSGFVSNDIVLAFPCKSLPRSQRAWLDQQETKIWPTKEMKKYMKTAKCFVVFVGSKVSENADFEWRISTSLAERCLMFNLNITQIRTYILLKMFLKTYINLDNECYISSYMCKNVLLHCIASKPSRVWNECNILNCVSYCLSTLKECISSANCPQFICRENNLMAGKLSAVVVQKLIERLSNLIPCDGNILSGIQIDNLGERLQIKLNVINELHLEIPQPDEYTLKTTTALIDNIATLILHTHNIFIEETEGKSLAMKLKTLLQKVLNLTRYYIHSDMLGKTACRLQIPMYCTSIGSLIASSNMKLSGTVSPQALFWLEAGLDSDVASSRLKLASIMYCSGYMERTPLILNNIEENYIKEITEPVCVCFPFRMTSIKLGFSRLSSYYDIQGTKNIVAFCVRFFPSEMNCVPHELKYEMFRSTHDELHYRQTRDTWMDCAVVDSLPYLYFLQYKAYSNLRRPHEQQQALNKLVRVIETELNLRHRETALNLLGQCMEQEKRLDHALNCFLISLGLKKDNNAARIHICRCLANVVSKRPTNMDLLS